jgi:hypothetical protein
MRGLGRNRQEKKTTFSIFEAFESFGASDHHANTHKKKTLQNRPFSTIFKYFPSKKLHPDSIFASKTAPQNSKKRLETLKINKQNKKPRALKHDRHPGDRSKCRVKH